MYFSGLRTCFASFDRASCIQGQKRVADGSNRLSVDTYKLGGCAKITRRQSSLEATLISISCYPADHLQVLVPKDKPHFLNSETRSRLNAALINARWENAWGVFPNCSPLLEISSLNIIK